jgi:mannosyltransferase OCH1-like enzyme
MIISHYTPSTLREVKKDIINAGTSNDNVKTIPLIKNYKNPKFFPRKFEKWSDEFEIILVGGNLQIRRSDVKIGGWGETLLIDVEFDVGYEDQQISPQKIPRVIYQTFEEYDVPNGMYNSVQSWKNLNPEYEHYYYTEPDRIEFIENFFDRRVLNAYLSIIPGAFKADLWRCCVLYINGGVYVDSDIICLKSLNDYIEMDDEFLITRDDPMSKSFLANGFIASIPNHPFLKQQIDSIVENVESKRECYYLEISGPSLFGKSVNKICGLDLDNEYSLGSSLINGFNLKILQHDWKTKTFNYDGDNVLYTEYKEKNEEMLLINNPTFYSLVQQNSIYQEIPRNIYHTSYDHLGINQYMVDSFKEKNKHWKLNYFTDKDCLDFFRLHNEEFKTLLGINVLSYYDSLVNGGEKSDFWRYCIIYLFGGVYTDSDTYCNIPLDKWIMSHDLILGIEANLPKSIAETFGMDSLGFESNGKIITVCNWSLAAKPKHSFFKNLIIDICNHNNGDVLTNTGPGRITKHAFKYFSGCDFNTLDNVDIVKGKSILFNINKFGSNQSHSNSYKNYIDPFNCGNDVYIVHMFDGTWRSKSNLPIKTHKSNIGVSHNLTLLKTNTGYKGVGRLDKDTSRTHFMKVIGDCRSLLEINYDFNFNIISESEKHITGFNNIAKFEDYRWFTFKNKNYLCVSYIDVEFNTKVSILDEEYRFLGDVKIDEYNRVSFVGPEKIWEKNWLFFEKENELYFIYSTNPKYVVYKCVNFETLEFEKDINIEWPLKENVPNNEVYFTSYVGCPIKIATGGSSNPIYIESRGVYLYFIHTKFYSEKKYNHYAVILDKNMLPIKFCTRPIIHKLIPYDLLFVSSVVEVGDHLVFSGGISDNANFIWQLSKEHIFKIIGI